jgi:phosphate transport system permease protein
MNLPGTRTVSSQFVQLRSLTMEQTLGGLVIAASALCLAGGLMAMASNSLDPVGVPLMLVISLSLIASTWQRRRSNGSLDREGSILSVFCVAGTVFLLLTPEYTYGLDFNAIVHHSFFTMAILMIAGTFGLSQGLYLYLGATPSARDISRYPLVVLPVVLVMVAYGMILGRVIDKGVPHLSLDAITSVYQQKTINDQITFEAGLRNQILGSLLLIVMTIGISLPIGVGAGMYMAEYPGKIARLIAISAQMLRAISLFVIGSAAINMVLWTTDLQATDPLSQVVRGSYTANGGYHYPGNGSFLLAACFVSLLVIPVIARATEEGLRSVPREIREGSIALGATEGHGILNIFMPWAFPVILTGILVGAAEAAGATAIMIFISGTGEFGVGPLHPAATLDVLIFQDRYGSKNFLETMGKYQYTAAFLLLVITLALTAAALYIKARAWRRYKGVFTT